MPLTLESIVVRSQEVMTSPVDDEMVMMALESSRYYGLNRVGRRIWELLEEPTTVAALCARLVSEFDVAPERCADEVLGFLGSLIEDGTVRTQNWTAR